MVVALKSEINWANSSICLRKPISAKRCSFCRSIVQFEGVIIFANFVETAILEYLSNKYTFGMHTERADIQLIIYKRLRFTNVGWVFF